MAERDKQGLSRHKADADWVEELNVVASTMECTGLIPTPPSNEAEMESYSDIYPIPEVGNPVNNGLQRVRGIHGDMTDRHDSNGQ